MTELAEVSVPDSGLPVFTSGEWSDHAETWRSLQEVEEDAKWKQAAIAASLVGKWGEGSVPGFASEVGCSARRIYEYAATYRAFAECERSQILSFHHHTIASRTEDPEKSIETAEVEQESTRQMSERVQREKSPEKSEPVEMLACPECGSAFRAQDAKRWTEPVSGAVGNG